MLVARSAPSRSLESSAFWGFGCGVLTGTVLAVLAGFAGGPLGDGRLAAVGPSAWQVGIVAALEIGVAAAVTAGLASWLHYRVSGLAAAPGPATGGVLTGGPAAASDAGAARSGAVAAPRPATGHHPVDRSQDSAPEDTGHVIYLNPWGDGTPAAVTPPASRGPASLP